MEEESDGIEEALEGTLRVAITAAGRLGEQFSRLREEELRRAEAVNDQEGRELTARYNAERNAAVASLAPVCRSEWWDRAGADDIGDAYETARAWSDQNPEVSRAEQRIRDEVRTRYGMDVDNAGGDPVAVRDAVERALALRVQAEQKRSGSRDGLAEAHRHMTDADRADRLAEAAREAAQHESDHAEGARAHGQIDRVGAIAAAMDADGRGTYDLAERRAIFADQLERQGIDLDAVAARIRADVSQAKPATEATRATELKTPKTRRARSGAVAKQLQHLGLDH